MYIIGENVPSRPLCGVLEGIYVFVLILLFGLFAD